MVTMQRPMTHGHVHLDLPDLTVAYRLVDPLGDRVVYEGRDTLAYLEFLRHYPVVEQEEGGDRVTEVYRQGRVPYLEILP